jgi:GWxTD domain-containing protein
MRYFLFLWTFLIFGCSFGGNTTKITPTEFAETSQGFGEKRPRFYAEYTNVVSEDTTKAKINIAAVAPRIDLSFTILRMGNAVYYRASVIWNAKLTFNDPNGKLTVSDGKSFRRELIVDSYEETRQGVTVAEWNFYVTPNASYDLEITLIDEETGASNKQVYPSVGSRLIGDGDFALADPIIFAAAIIDSAGVSFIPLNSRQIDPWQRVPFFVVIYYPPKDERIRLYYEIIGPDGEIVFQKNQLVPPTQGNWAFDTLFVELPDEAGNGNYSLHAMATSESGKAASFTALKSFVVYSIIPRSAKEIDEAARQMVYVPGADKIIAMIEKASTSAEKRRLLLEFWEKRYSSPEEGRIYMREYYRRVDFANRNFRNQNQPGWRTDRGMVYIRFGPPDSVDRYLGSWAKSYEIWHYYNLRRRDFYYTRKLGIDDYNWKFFIFTERFIGNYTFGDGDIYHHNITEFEDEDEK